MYEDTELQIHSCFKYSTDLKPCGIPGFHESSLIQYQIASPTKVQRYYQFTLLFCNEMFYIELLCQLQI